VTLIELLAALVNPLDSRALVASLLSPVFNLSDDVLLWLAADGEPYQRLREQLDEQAPSSGDPNLAVVARLFERAVCSVGSIQTSQIMRELLSAGGWTALLLEAGEDGIPVLANITKLLRMLDDWEAQHGIDPVGFSCRLRKLQSFLDAGGRVEGLHPGVLQTDDSGAVRIMTIHSSKGLEYPVVAVAEYAGDHIRENETACYRSFDGEQIAVAIKPWPWSLGTNTWGSVVQELLDEIGSSRTSAHEAETALEHFAFLRTASCLAELPERQRLLYVACTRAREALILGLRDSTIAGEPPGLPKKPRAALFGNLETALFPNDGFPHESTAFTFGPSESPITGYYDFEVVGASDEKSETSEGADATADGRVTGFGMVRAIRPQVCEDILAGMQGSFAKPQDIFSYSSLAARREDDDALTGQKRVWTFKSLTLPKHDDDRDHALRFGLAFHAEARRWIDEGMDERVCDGVDDGGTCSLGDNHGQLAAQDAKRLTEAYCAWVCSKRAASLRTYEKVLTEYPFVVEATDGFILEGRIDVLALDFAKNRALIIDYKTGVSAEGASAALEERYRLQAQCYACAVLKGFETTQSGEATGEEAGEWYTGKMGGRIEEIELAFVRPEVLDAKTGEPEEVVYRFTCNDVPALTAALTSLSAPSSPAADNY
jgi:ATP-dependent exoDNAse (exonuclease V) beta subunit